MHGYTLASELATQPGWEGTATLSSVYACLNRLERLGYLNSKLQRNPDGPRRRVYSLRRTGSPRPDIQEETIRAGEQKLEAILAAYLKCRTTLDQVRRARIGGVAG